MGDRYRSLLGSQVHKQILSYRQNELISTGDDLVNRLQIYPARLSKMVQKYQLSVRQEEWRQIEADYRREQEVYRRERELLCKEVKRLEYQDKNSQMYQYLKKGLVRTVQKEMNIDLQFNEQVSLRMKTLQARKEKMNVGSPELRNALHDIDLKIQEIKHLQKSMQECLELLGVIGELVFEQGEKIQQIKDRVVEANAHLQRAEYHINRVKVQQQKARNRMCCIIILALVAVILILILLFGLKIINI